jgi:transcriptional regulator with XRE-family HTH domain
MLWPVSTIGGNIKRLRKQAGYETQGAFAEAIKVPQPRLADWENDRYKRPELPNLIRMAKALGVSVDVILAGVDPEYDRLSHKSDLPFHSDQVDSAKIARTQGSTHSDADSSDTTRRLESVLKELLDAAGIFGELAELSADWSARATEWQQRLTALTLQSVPRRQTPVARLDTPRVSKGHRTDHRRPDGTRRKRSA